MIIRLPSLLAMWQRYSWRSNLMDSQERKHLPSSRMRLLRPISGQPVRIFQNKSSQLQREQLERRKEPVVSYCDLGIDTRTGELVRIGDVERRSGVYILGKP